MVPERANPIHQNEIYICTTLGAAAKAPPPINVMRNERICYQKMATWRRIVYSACADRKNGDFQRSRPIFGLIGRDQPARRRARETQWGVVVYGDLHESPTHLPVNQQFHTNGSMCIYIIYMLCMFVYMRIIWYDVTL